MTKILAIDPASSCGWAWTDGTTIESGTWNIAVGGFGGTLGALRSQINYIGQMYGFEVMSYERPAYGYADWSVTAHIEKIAILKLTCFDAGAEWHEGYVPTSIKKYATGNGKATKEEMMLACERVLRIKPETDDQADALWILDMVKRGYVTPAAAAKKIKQRVARDKTILKQTNLFAEFMKPRRSKRKAK